jgi:hypothetical protein
VTRGASHDNLSQAEPLLVYFGCGDVNNGEEAYGMLGLRQMGFTTFDELILNDKFFHSFSLCFSELL